MKNVLLLSPYDALSHRQWREGLVAQMSHWKVTTVALPPRFFSWRFRGNSLTLSQRTELDGNWDAVIATSMTDLSALRGMRPALTRCPNILYFHENQFAYPDDARDEHRLERQITSLYSALAADRVLFNSEYNRRTFLAGAGEMLNKMPDEVPAGVVEHVEGKSAVVPVPIDPACFREREKPAPFSIVWNHRWEYDKGPEELLEIVKALLEAELEFVFHVVGQPFRSVPASMTEVLDLLREAGRLGEHGFLDRPAYLDLLARSHVVLSTARHEFQGLAVLEASAAGCSPVVPDRLAYVELFPNVFRFSTTETAISRILDLFQQFQRGETLPQADVAHLSWPQCRDAWGAVLE